MIAARIGVDLFAVWRTAPGSATMTTAMLPTGLRPVHDERGGWLMLACARLERVRAFGLPLHGAPIVAAWLVPVQDGHGRIGNWFCSTFSNHRAVVAAYGALGMPAVSHRSMHIDGNRSQRRSHGFGSSLCLGFSVDGLRISLGPALDHPQCPWFTRDRCGFIAHGKSWRRLPLAKRGWHHREHQLIVSGDHPRLRTATPITAINCSFDLAMWGMPQRST